MTCLNLRDIPLNDLVKELKRRKDKVSFLNVKKGEPLDISIDAKELELRWCEGPLEVLVVDPL